MSRTFKKAYTKSKRFDKSCRNNGSCDYCRGNRLHKHKKQPTLQQELDLLYGNMTEVVKVLD